MRVVIENLKEMGIRIWRRKKFCAGLGPPRSVMPERERGWFKKASG